MNQDNNTTNLIFGIRPVQEALREGKSIDKIFIQNNLRGPHTDELMEDLGNSDVPVMKVPSQKLNRLTRKNHQGVIAMISPVQFHPVEEIIQGIYESGDSPLILFLDRVTDVRNFGAIVRTAECMGVQAIVVPEKGAARIGGDAVKTSAGALLRIPIARVKYPAESLKALKDYGLQLIGISEKGEKNISETSLDGPKVIIMGSEDDSISPSLIKECDLILRIPMVGKIGSLNVGVAAGMALYECLRQVQLK